MNAKSIRVQRMYKELNNNVENLIKEMHTIKALYIDNKISYNKATNMFVALLSRATTIDNRYNIIERNTGIEPDYTFRIYSDLIDFFY